MSTQTIYIARHGLTEGNIAGLVQGFDDPLAPHGHEQAKTLAERAAHLSFTHLLASDMLRAQQTAAYISEATGHEVISEPLVHEVVRPASLVGIVHTDSRFQEFLEGEYEQRHDPNWRYEDAENFSDVRTRALAALDRFASFGTDTLFVVSHGHFIRVLMGAILAQGDLTPDLWVSVNRALRTHNTGISIVRRDIEENHWQIISFNDHAHFADY